MQDATTIWRNFDSICSKYSKLWKICFQPLQKPSTKYNKISHLNALKNPVYTYLHLEVSLCVAYDISHTWPWPCPHGCIGPPTYQRSSCLSRPAASACSQVCRKNTANICHYKSERMFYNCLHTPQNPAPTATISSLTALYSAARILPGADTLSLTSSCVDISWNTYITLPSHRCRH